MESAPSGPPRPRSRRAQSGMTNANNTALGAAPTADEWRKSFGKPNATSSSAAASHMPPQHQSQHRHTRSVVHTHSHHHLHLHGSHGSNRPRSHTSSGSKAAAAAAESYLSPDSRMEKLKKVGSRLKDNAAPSRSSEYNRSQVGSLVRQKQDIKALQTARIALPSQRQRQRALVRDGEIRGAYKRISDASMTNINKLDTVYYSILERLSTLQSTIGGLQELAVQTKELRSTFDSDVKHVEEHTQSQISAFGGFEKQKDRIAQLEARIRDGKFRTETLTERLEIARTRVRNLENKEAEVQASISFQFRIVWSILGGIMTIVMALLLANYFIPLPRRDLLDGPTLPSNSASRHANGATIHSSLSDDASTDNGSDLVSSLTDFIVKQRSNAFVHTTSEMQETVESATETAMSSKSTAITNSEHLEEDPRLRLFEEL